jgi:Tfp pilus assembly protein PilF
MKVKTYSYPFLFSVFVAMAFGQASRPPMTSTPSPVTSPTRPGSIQDSGMYNYWTEMTEQGRAGGFLLGKLRIEGESLLWEPIPIVVACNGKPIVTTQTDPKGNFAIHPTTIPGKPILPAQAKQEMETHFEGCTVQASLAGFGSTTLTLTQHNLRDDPTLEPLTLFRKEDRGKGSAVSQTISTAPAEAAKLFEKARTELLDQRPEKAQRDLEKSIQLYPGFAEAWYQLAKLQQLNDPQTARKSYAQAAAADPLFTLPYVQLAALNAQDGKWQEVLDSTNHVLELDSTGTVLIWYYNGLANFQMGKYGAAEASASKALALDPSHTLPNLEQLMAVLLAKKGSYGEALAHLRICLTYLPVDTDASFIKQQIAMLEKKVAASKQPR